MNRQLELKPSHTGVYLVCSTTLEENILGFTNIILRITSEGVYLWKGKHVYDINTVNLTSTRSIMFHRLPRKYQP